MILVTEILILLAIFIVGAGLAAPIRHRTSSDRPGLGTLVHHLCRPGLVLLITLPTVTLLNRWPAAAAHLDANPMHVQAWIVFWLGVLGLGLAEAVARQIIVLRGREWPLPDLLEEILRAVLILALAFVVLKVELGLDIGPLLASTALVTAVLGFALQGVLGNLLAGMSLNLTRTVKQGDWVSLDGAEGRVKRTNWRETRISTVGGHELIVPNSRVAEAIVHNLNHPTPMRRHGIDIGASYSDAPDDVIAALEEAAAEVPEVQAKPVPEAILTSYEDYGINYRLRYWTRQYHRRDWVDAQVSRLIWYKFKRRGIEIPFPMSDKLLNDFMTVVYNQRKLEPETADLDAVARDLMAVGLFDNLLTDEDCARLAPLVRREAYTRGEILMRQDEPGDCFHILVSGRLAGAIDPDVAFTVEAGAVVGEMSLLTGEPRSATLTTETGCDILTFDRNAFVALLGLREEIPEKLADLAAERAASNRAAAEKARETATAAGADRGERSGILRRLLGLLGR